MITLTHQVGARHASPASPKSLASLPFQAINVLGCLTAGQACLTPTGGQDEIGLFDCGSGMPDPYWWSKRNC